MIPTHDRVQSMMLDCNTGASPGYKGSVRPCTSSGHQSGGIEEVQSPQMVLEVL